MTATTRRRLAAAATAVVVTGSGLVALGGAAAAAGDTSYTIERSGSGYTATGDSGGSYSGSLKQVVEQAVASFGASGGRISFTAGDFDLGSDYFKFQELRNVTFAGQGPGQTLIRNVSDAATDTEPFNFTGTLNVVVRDLTVSAGGPARNTSDALDFDGGNSSSVLNVEVVESRGRGIVFDGKDEGRQSQGNIIRDCAIHGVGSDGIELLAATGNVVENCRITDVGGHGIQLAKASVRADQPNKESSGNVLRGNVIDQAGQDGVNLHGGDENQILGNTITNSADDTDNRDGIKISGGDGVFCDDNQVIGNTATDNQATKTQRYGLAISDPACRRTLVGRNDFSGNRVDAILDRGTDTRYSDVGTPPPDNPPPDNPPPDNPPPDNPPPAEEPPVVQMTAPGKDFTLRRVRAAWRTTDEGAAATSYELLGKVAGTRGGFTRLEPWITTESTGVRFRGQQGATYCMRVRGTSAAGDEGRLSAARCTAVPLDDRRLREHGSWRAVDNDRMFRGGAVRTRQEGAALSTRVRFRDLALVATTCRQCGSVRVLLGGEELAEVSLATDGRRHRRVIPIASQDQVQRGRLRVVVTSSGAPVLIDGVGAALR